ncbi:HD-GYP domain-containing protein [Bacillus massiliglaciei]|uniref:HD-GYP domain-containing protein n=1 Tax=Bacillus massiliglaciei TaxID=1816693 RepID=UPI001F376A59|nr:HD-GYP domain-containing protein [Bacillus massiliglaciei]
MSTRELVDGCIIAKEVKGLLNRPLMKKNTILNQELIEVLHAFLVTDVSVEKALKDGSAFKPKEILDYENETAEKEDKDFIRLYLTAVQKYKKLFHNWQAGSKVEVGKIREIIIPLYETAMKNPADLFTLHHYSTKEDYIYHHAISLGLLSGYLTQRMNYTLADTYQMTMGGCVVDCGMAKVSPSILKKTMPLSMQENEEIKQHPIYSLQMIKDSFILKSSVKMAIFEHHERMNGTGYPARKKNGELNTFSQIIAVADVYHAMTSERTYRKKQSPFKVMELIMHDSFGKFDIAVVRTLVNGLMQYTIGRKVRLNNGLVGEIMFIDAAASTRPLIKVIDSNEMIHLAQNRDLYIEELI